MKSSFKLYSIAATSILTLLVINIYGQSRNIAVLINENTAIRNQDLLVKSEQILVPFSKENLIVDVSLIKLDDNVAGDIEKVYTTKYEYALTFKDIITENTVVTESSIVIGSGSNASKANVNVLQQLNKVKPLLQNKLKAQFAKRGPMSCKALTDVIQHLSAKNDFERIISLHTQDCPEAEKLVMGKWQDQQTKECQNMLQIVKAHIAVADFEKAIHGIIKIDPNSNCKAELDAVIKDLETKYKSTEDKEYNLYLEYYRNQKNDPRELYPLFLMNFDQK